MKLIDVMKILSSKASNQSIAFGLAPLKRPKTELDFREFQRGQQRLAQRAPLGYSIDSRTVREGELFFTIKGENHDGHNFVAEVLHKGALGVVINREATSAIQKQLAPDSRDRKSTRLNSSHTDI